MENMARYRGDGSALGVLCALLIYAGLAGDRAAAETPIASCDVTQTLGYCMEYHGSDWSRQGAQDDCDTAPNGSFSVEPCPPTDRVGVCVYLPRGTDESRLDYIFYAPTEVSTANMSCPGTFTTGE